MNFIEALKLAINNLLSYKVRSFLTMLGIIIGIGAVIMMSSLGAGMKENITGDLNKLGVGNFEIQLDTSPGKQYKTEDLLTTRDIEYIKKIPNVTAVSPSSSTFTRSTVNNKNKMFSGTGVTEDYFKIVNFDIIKGRKFLPDEYRKDGKYLIIDSSSADRLFPNKNPIGKTIELELGKNKQVVTIVGVFSYNIGSLSFGDDEGGGIPIIGLLPNQYLNFINGNQSDKFTSLQVKVNNANNLNEAMEMSRNYLKTRGSSTDTYRVSSLSQGLSQFNDILNMITLFISGVAAISLFVGGIGVMNIMLVSVTERIREVGLRKAIGAKTKDILVQFLIESIILTFFGGIIGIITGYGMALLIGMLVHVSPILSPFIVIICITVSTITGLVFGVYPAKKAAALDPMVALRVD